MMRRASCAAAVALALSATPGAARVLHTSQGMSEAAKFAGTKEDNDKAVTECAKLSADECASAGSEWRELVEKHNIAFNSGTRYRCTPAWTCSSGVQKAPCPDVEDDQQQKSCLPLNMYRCLVAPDGELAEACPAMEAIGRLKKAKAKQIEEAEKDRARRALELVVQQESPAPAPAPSPEESPVRDERVSLPETDLASMTLEEVKEFEEENMDKMSLLDRLILTNLKQQLEEQEYFCVSTCVVCVPKKVDIEKDTLRFVSKSILVQRAKGMWQLSKGLLGAGFGAYVGGLVGGTVGVVSGISQGSEHGFLSGAWQGVSQGVTGTLSGTGVGTLAGASLVFDKCSASGMVSHYADGKYNDDYSASRLGKGGMAKLSDNTRVGWVASWYKTENKADVDALQSCGIVENKVYDPRTMMHCMSHTSMCGPDSWALPMMASSDDECKALSHASAAQTEMDVWNLEKQV